MAMADCNSREGLNSTRRPHNRVPAKTTGEQSGKKLRSLVGGLNFHSRK